MSIRELGEKIKFAVGEATKKLRSGAEEHSRYYTGAIIIIVGLSSFGLGRLSILDERREPIVIEETADAPINTGVRAIGQEASVGKNIEPIVSLGGKVVASKNGTKYYLPWCAGAQKIAEANKVWFNSEADAKAKGYGPAANCKGLK